MIESIELSPSDRAICKWCGKKIGIGTPRGVESSSHGNHTEHKYCCYKCLDKKFEFDKADIRRLFERTQFLKKEAKKMINQSQKAIILANLE